MNFKRSIYNVEIEELQDGKRLVYNTYSGAYGIMDEKTQIMYNNIDNIDVYEVFDEENLSKLKIMANSGYIVPSEKDELSVVKLERAMSRYNRDTLGITITPTMDCNMRCPYCYENRSEMVMSRETQEKLIEFVKVHFDTKPNIKQLSTTWYGGEPLLQKEMMFDLSQKLISLCEEKDIKYFSGMTTNGVLLDLETSKKLAKDCKISNVQITIDGMREVHNKRRILINGEDSYGIIMKNIEDCKEIMSIAVRINVDKENADGIEALVRCFIEEKKWAQNPQFYFAPVDKYNESCGIEKSSCLQGEEFARFVDKHKRISYDLNRDDVAKGFFPSRKSIFCSAETVFNYVIDPEGYLYTCWHYVNVKDRSIGHISKPFVINKEYSKWLLSDLPIECEKCTYLPMCQGGCGDFRISEDKEPQCFHAAYSYKDNLRLAYEDYISQKSKQEAEVAATQA